MIEKSEYATKYVFRERGVTIIVYVSILSLYRLSFNFCNNELHDFLC